MRCRSLRVLLWLFTIALSTTPALGDEKDGVSVRISGNSVLTQSRILADIRFWLDDLRAAPGDPSALIDTAYAIENLYRSLGRPRASVQGTAEQTGAGWKIRFTVDEGPAFIVDKVKVRGNQHLTDEVIAKQFSWQRAGILDTGDNLYGESELQSGLSAIKIRYQVDGFLDVVVDATPTERPRKDHVDVRIDITITEGTRYHVREFKVITPTEMDHAEILGAVGLRPGAVFSRRLPGEVESRVDRFLRNQGYFDPVVLVDTEAAGPGLFDLILEIFEGDPVAIGSIEVLGAEHTSADWIRARLPFRVDRGYKVESLDEGRRQLLRTGLFEQVTITATANEDDESLLDVIVEVSEKQRLRLSTQIGFGSYELGRFGVEIFHRNMFGSGLEARLLGKVSFRGEEVDGNLRLPLQTSRPMALTLRARYRRFEEVSFERQESELTTGIEITLKDRAVVTTGYTIRDEQVHEPEDAVPVELLEDSRSALLFLKVQRDRRDSVLDPSRGYIATIRSEFASEELGSELHFVRLQARCTGIWEFREGWTVIGSVRAGYLRPLQSDEIPLGERFFLGGSRTVRSFTRDALGPRDASNNPIGGEAFTLANLEIRYPIWKQLGGTAFVDAGSLHSDHNDFSRSDYRYAAGGGLLFHTPIGPVRVDAAGTLNREAGEDSWALHILLGHPF